MSFNFKHKWTYWNSSRTLQLKNSGSEKLLGVNFDRKLNFDFMLTIYVIKQIKI